MIKSTCNNRGFTLVEVMVAMVITLIGLMGLLQAVSIAREHNMKTMMRDEAGLIADQYMSNLKVRAFEQLSGVTVGGVTTGPFHSRQLKSRLRGGNFSYTLDRTCTSLGTDTPSAEMVVKVSWTYKGEQKFNEIRSVRSQ